jgi:predicted negative regulator of RcsB-dependent stress response
LSLESRKNSAALEDPGAHMVDQLTSVWQRYARIVLAVLGAIVVVGGVAYYTIQQNKAQENLASRKLAEADMLFWQGDYDRAKTAADEVVKTYGSTPSGIDAHRVSGDAAYWRGNFKASVTEYKAYLARKSAGTVAQSVRRSLAYALDSDKQYAEAVKLYDGLVGVFDRETSAEMLSAAGRCLLETNDKAGAIQRYQRISNEFGETSAAQSARVKLAELGSPQN